MFVTIIIYLCSNVGFKFTNNEMGFTRICIFCDNRLDINSNIML